jgi:xylulokinase
MILAVDLGTTNCKVLALDPSCRIIHSTRLEYSIVSPRQGWAEQDPEAWWSTVRSAVRSVASKTGGKQIDVIGISGQMHGLVALDGGRKVLRPAILWNDQRAEAQCQQVYSIAGGREGLASLTNNAMLPGYVGGKLLWVKENEPDIFARIRTILLPKDYILYRMCGEYGTDVSEASGTGLFDVRARTWAHGLLDIMGIPEGWLPGVHESREVAGALRREAAEELGLAEGTQSCRPSALACSRSARCWW